MATRTWGWVGSMIVILLGLVGTASAQTLGRFSFAEPHLGTIVEITIYADEDTVANEAARAAFERIKQLDLVFSDYKPESEVMRLCDNAMPGIPVAVSTDLFRVLKIAQTVSKQTDGAFDVTVGPLVQLWRQARKLKKLPSPDAIAAAQRKVGWQRLTVNEADQSVELAEKGMRLDFGGIAKGYIAHEVSHLLRKRGLPKSLVAVAGDIVAGDAPPDAEGWKIGVAPLLPKEPGTVESPSRLLLLKNCAVSTSGDAFQFVEVGGVRYSHIVDPKTGIGLTHRSSVTIVADDGGMADALATAVCVLGPRQGQAFIRQVPGVDALIVQASESGIELIETENFRRREYPPNSSDK